MIIEDPGQKTPRKQLIFLVEDDEATSRFMRLILESDGFTLRTTSSRELALEALSEQTPDAIIMDYLMGGLPPDAFIERAREAGYQGRFLLCTAMQKELNLPVDDVLFKPFDPDELALRVNRLLATDPS